jgi:hypothetical protein
MDRKRTLWAIHAASVLAMIVLSAWSHRADAQEVSDVATGRRLSARNTRSAFVCRHRTTEIDHGPVIIAVGPPVARRRPSGHPGRASYWNGWWFSASADRRRFSRIDATALLGLLPPLNGPAPVPPPPVAATHGQGASLNGSEAPRLSAPA